VRVTPGGEGEAGGCSDSPGRACWCVLGLRIDAARARAAPIIRLERSVSDAIPEQGTRTSAIDAPLDVPWVIGHPRRRRVVTERWPEAAGRGIYRPPATAPSLRHWPSARQRLPLLACCCSDMRSLSKLSSDRLRLSLFWLDLDADRHRAAVAGESVDELAEVGGVLAFG
jgi:hypothetical protein